MNDGDRQPLDELAELEAAEPRQRRTWSLWLLLIPIAAVVVPSLYNGDSPRIAGVPFFVWYQLAAVTFGGIVTGIVYVLRGTEQSLER